MMSRYKPDSIRRPRPSTRAAELKWQLSQKLPTLDDQVDYSVQTPQAKAALTRARNQALQRGDFTDYIYKPPIPVQDPGVRHIPDWRFFVCCNCDGVCWFRLDPGKDVEQHVKCGSGRNLGHKYCGHARCQDCHLESVEGECWLYPGMSQQLAIKYCDEDQASKKPDHGKLGDEEQDQALRKQYHKVEDALIRKWGPHTTTKRELSDNGDTRGSNVGEEVEYDTQ